jgi:peptidoglycan/LPS O-acetylase OafA/YrhL
LTDKDNLPGLDGLRGVLAIVVCLGHAHQIFIGPVEADGTASAALFAWAARLAVLWFFSLSGFVIAISVERNTARHGRFRVADYALSRAARILPPLIVVMVLTATAAVTLNALGWAETSIARAARRSYTDGTITQLFCLAQLTAGCSLTADGTRIFANGPLWSLAFEIQLYVLAAVACAFSFARTLSLRLLIGALGVVFLLRAYIWLPAHSSAPQMILCYVCFGCGWLAANIRPKCGISLVAAAFGMTMFVGIIVSRGMVASVPAMDSWSSVLIGEIGFGFGAAAVLPVVGRLGLSRLKPTGDFSYTLYILHFPLMLAAFFVVTHTIVPTYSLPAGWLMAAIFAPLAIMASWLLAHVIEKPKEHRALVRRLYAAHRQA